MNFHHCRKYFPFIILERHCPSSSSMLFNTPTPIFSDPEEDEMLETAANFQDGTSSLHEHVSASSCAPNSEERSTEVPAVFAAQGKYAFHTSGSDVKHGEAPDVSKKNSFAADSVPVHSSVLASENCESAIKFQGLESLNVRSNVLSILQPVWNKYGNLVGENTRNSRDMLVCALESLAKIIVILQNTTPKTLNDSLAKDLESNLYDLQCVKLRIDWLIPFVKRAVELHKCTPLIESITAIEKSKTQADEEEIAFLARSAIVKQVLEECRACLAAKLPFPEPIDLDQCLGEGLI